MKKFAFVFAAPLFACASLFADAYADMQSYKAGDSLSWFYEIRTESLKKGSAKSVEAKILETISAKEIDNAAFERACEILKPIATKKSVPVLAKFLNDDFRAPWVCSVFVTLDSSSVDSALADSLEKADEKCAMTVLSTLAARGSSKGLDALEKYAQSDNKNLALFAVSAMVKYEDAVKTLSRIADKNDFRRDAALDALSLIAYRAAKSGDKSLATDALESVPADYPMSIGARAELAKNRVKYLDSIIIADGKNVARAGRLIYNARKFADSEEIIAAFPKLSKEAKLAAMSTFMLSGDTRFYPTIAPLLDSNDRDLLDEAVYSARFICTDEANLRKIYALTQSDNKILASHARNVFEENPSFAAVRILKDAESKGDLFALEMLVIRGDLDAAKKLETKFFDGGYKDAKISQMYENLITYGELPKFASRLNGADDGLRKAICKVIIKKLARNKDKDFVAETVYEVLSGKVPAEDEKFIASKLRVKPRKFKEVWQKEFRARGVEDKLMKVAEEREPKIDASFVSLFDGKTLNGWKTTTGTAFYGVKDGCIYGKVVDQKKKENSFLITERADYKNFIFTCEFKWEELGNSGVIFKGYFEKRKRPDGSEYDRVVGPQAEMDENPRRRWTGGVYNEGVAWKYSLSREDQEQARNALDLLGWNRMTIKCDGDRMQTWVNGVPTADFEWEGVKPGFIGLQVHFGKTGAILWRNVKIKEL
ncbi:MAG: family 16 glycoside hydrolase [Candidatus Merdousia sp.]|nr:family 16 glycoside hydrolase [Candidatus Merdousia sp.]